ncbi:hypothetical protein BVX97_02290 [bacterium E08(2017)]|nr:hypothetical protein BVX97_02290 [bacterium E08(2017)]
MPANCHAECRRFAVLVCDDDESYRCSQARMLNLFNWGERSVSFKAYEAASGAEAIEVLKRQKIDCILLDYDMPVCNGIDVMRTILEKYPELAVVIVTGAGDEMTAVEAMKIGAVDYLNKGGISIEQMEKTIINAVTRARIEHQLEDRSKKLLEATQKKVMLESIASACHHLAQPVTVLRTYIVLLKRKANDEESKQMLVEAYKAVELISDIIWKLNRLEDYKTEPYLEGDEKRKGTRMIKLENR